MRIADTTNADVGMGLKTANAASDKTRTAGSMFRFGCSNSHTSKQAEVGELRRIPSNPVPLFGVCYGIQFMFRPSSRCSFCLRRKTNKLL